MPSKTNYNCILGTLVCRYLQNIEPAEQFPDFYNRISLAVLKVIEKIITQNDLDGSITKDQKDDSVEHIVGEIITEPKLSEKDIANADGDELRELKESLHVSSKLREIALESNPAPRLHSYLKLRALTVLKKYATDKAKEYFLLNNRIKRTLKELFERQEIFQPIPKHYSFNNTETALFQSRYCKPNMSKELSIELQRRRPNLKRLIKLFLKANDQYLFNGKDIVKYFIPMFLKEPKEENLVINNKVENEQEDGNPVIIDENFDIELEIVASEAVKNLSYLTCSNKGLQQEMALLVYFYREHPKYFSKKILTEKEENLNETDAIEFFLNKRVLCNFNKSKKVGRTTASNRKNEGLTLVKNTLLGLSTDAQVLFLQKYCEYLEKRFIKITGVSL